MPQRVHPEAPVQSRARFCTPGPDTPLPPRHSRQWKEVRDHLNLAEGFIVRRGGDRSGLRKCGVRGARRSYLLREHDILVTLKHAGRLMPNQDWIGWFDEQIAQLRPGRE
jgi:hypothetical protein